MNKSLEKIVYENGMTDELDEETQVYNLKMEYTEDPAEQKLFI